MEYVYAQINATVKKEKARRSKERKVEAVVENDSEAVVTEKEIATVFNYPSTLARYRKVFADAPGNNDAKRRGATTFALGS